MTKKRFELIIGGNFTAQPKYKPKIIPEDFLAKFCNVNPCKFDGIINFANKYSFGGYLIPDENDSIEDKFAKIQAKYKPIIGKLISQGTISYVDIKSINQVLKTTAPKISLREKVNDTQKIESSFAVYMLRSIGNERPRIEVKPIGAFDVDKKAAHIQVTVEAPANTQSIWYLDRIPDGLTRIKEIFPSEKWETHEDFLDQIILKNAQIHFDSTHQPISIEMNFWLGKTNFSKEELVAAWSSNSGEAFIAKRIWDYINTENKNKRFKQCKICGELHIGRSQDYCGKVGCRKEWDSKRHIKR